MASDLIEKAAARLMRDGAQPPRSPAAAIPVPPLAPAHRPVPAQAPQPNAAQQTANGEAEAGRLRGSGGKARITLDTARLARAGVITPHTRQAHLIEEFRIIKRPLLRNAFRAEAGANPKANLLMVTSARPGEGKSFVACNLAMSIASEKNTKVVLVDTDSKNPALQDLFGVRQERGLFDLLLDAAMDVGDVLLPTSFSNLSIIPAGTPAACGHGHATELLASQRMAALTREMAHRYDDRLVIFDAAPVLASSEPGVLALLVGQIVLVVEAEQTTRRTVEEAIGLLQSEATISLLLNKARAWLGAEQFGAYYDYSANGS
jgi:exopolysaccharide/PEP-CTERM locus tyrosine autokinase